MSHAFIPVVQREEDTTAEFDLPYLLFPPIQHPSVQPDIISFMNMKIH